MTDCRYLIQHFYPPETPSNGTFKGQSPTSRSTIVTLDDTKTHGPQALGSHIRALRPTAIDALNVRTTIDGTNQRIRTWTVHRCIWSIQGSMKGFGPVTGWKRDELGCNQLLPLIGTSQHVTGKVTQQRVLVVIVLCGIVETKSESYFVVLVATVASLATGTVAAAVANFVQLD
jgi:hypothetical protein